MNNTSIVAEFLKEMKEKHPPGKDSDIVITLSADSSALIVSEVTYVERENDWWEELERIEIK